MLLLIDNDYTSETEEERVTRIIQEVSMALDEKGYDPINQIVGYLMSGDPGYISSYKDARKKITECERTKILNILVKNFLNL